MTSLFQLLFLSIIGFIIYVHSYGIWRVYKSEIGDQRGIEMLGRGFAAGLAGWFWLCALLGFWNSESGGGLMIFIWLYGVLFVPWIGVFLTLIFAWMLNKFELHPGFYSRALIGSLIGMILGIVVGIFLDSKSYHSGQNIIYAMFVLFGTMGLTSGIMSGESSKYD